VSAIVEHGNIEPEPVTEPVTDMQVLQRVVAMSSSSRVAPKLREIEIGPGPGHGLGHVTGSGSGSAPQADRHPFLLDNHDR
jgi:hypothetical protein